MRVRIFAILLAFMLVAGCISDFAGYSDDADMYLDENGEHVPEHPESYSEDDSENEDEYAPAPGLWDYTFIWEQGRNREWEEDIIYFAQTFLFVHPIMRNVQIPITDVQSILHDAGIGDLTENFHNPDLRSHFLESIHMLISNIPELEDHEIIFSLSKIATLLGDSHTGIMLSTTAFPSFNQHYYPFHFTYFADGFFVEKIWRPRGTLAAYEDVLYSRLKAINGIESDEIIQIFSKVLPHESTYDIPAKISLFDLLRHSELLGFLGITEGSETEFTFENAEGDLFKITTSPYAELDAEIILSDVDRETFLIYSRPDWRWFEFLDEYNTMYARINNFFWAPSPLSFAEFYQSLVESTRTALELGNLENFIIDLRGNRGGFLDNFDMLFDLIYSERHRIDSVFVLIDNFTYSSGVIAAAILREYIADVLLLGDFASQSPNFFAAPSAHSLPNSGIPFSVSRVFFQILPEHTNYALSPDIVIPWSFEYFKSGIDPVLEAILAGIGD